MKILYFIIREKGRDAAAERIIAMCQAVRQQTEVAVISYPANMPASPHSLITLKNEILSSLYNHMPQIVHIYGCWNLAVSLIVMWTRCRGFLTIYSPYGSLQQLTTANNRRWKTYIPRWITYQRRTLFRATAIIAQSNSESALIKRLCHSLRPIVVDRTATDENIANQLIVAYSTLIKRHTLKFMSQDEKIAIFIFLRIAADMDNSLKLSSQPLPKDSCTQHETAIIARLSQQQLDRITNVAEAQHIAHLLSQATKQLNLNYNFTENNNTIINNDNNHQGLIIQMKQARQNLKKSTFTLPQLISLYIALKTADSDEQQLCLQLRKSHLLSFASRMIAILSETLNLESGYMPMFPRNDLRTEKIRQRILRSIMKSFNIS